MMPRRKQVGSARRQDERLASDPHSVSDAVAFFLLVLINAGMLALVGITIAIGGGFRAICWAVG